MSQTLLMCCGLMIASVFSSLSDAAEVPADNSGYVTRLFVADPDGANPKPVMHVPDYLGHGSPAWTQDGKLLAVDAYRPAKGETFRECQILVTNRDGSKTRLLGDGAMPSFSPGGRRIAFSRYSPNQGVWIMSADGPETELVLIDEGGWGADWSPDGTRIAYTRYDSGGANFCVFSLVEGTREFLFAEGESPYQQIYWNFSWSPDSRTIAFRGVRKDGKDELALIDARGAKYGLRKRLDAPFDTQIGWTADGKLLISRGVKDRGNRGQIHVLDPATEDPPVLLPGQPSDLALASPTESADGKALAFVVRFPPPPKTP